MTRRLAQFDLDITRARDLVGLGQSFSNITHGVVDAADIYRAALVQAVAALDHYCHGVILDKGVDVLLGRSLGGASTRVGISFGAVQDILGAANPADREQTARRHIAQRLSLETFQRGDAIAQGFAMVGIPKLWTTAFPSPAAAPITQLNLIVERRNKIVHQGDNDPLVPGSPTALSDVDALDAVNAINSMVYAIDVIC